MEKKNLVRDLIVYCISVTALACATLNMQVSRNMLRTDNTKKDKR